MPATPTLTPRHQLANIALGDDGPLETFVRSRRAEGQSWRLIALALYDATDRKVNITHVTLRTWFPDEAQP